MLGDSNEKDPASNTTNMHVLDGYNTVQWWTDKLLKHNLLGDEFFFWMRLPQPAKL
jgi:hypothetical protein